VGIVTSAACTWDESLSVGVNRRDWGVTCPLTRNAYVQGHGKGWQTESFFSHDAKEKGGNSRRRLLVSVMVLLVARAFGPSHREAGGFSCTKPASLPCYSVLAHWSCLQRRLLLRPGAHSERVWVRWAMVWLYRGLDSGPQACWEGALPLKPHLQSILLCLPGVGHEPWSSWSQPPKNLEYMLIGMSHWHLADNTLLIIYYFLIILFISV
jgi:hypothetical protein